MGMTAGENTVSVTADAQVLNVDNEFWIFGYGYARFHYGCI